jgi:hypothetical protein
MIVDTLSITERPGLGKNVEELAKETTLAMEDWRLMLPVRAKHCDGIALEEQTEHAKANPQWIIDFLLHHVETSKII